MADESPACANCKKTATAANLASLKACAKCKTTQYCGRDCQKADWKTHKKVCAKVLLRPSSRPMPNTAAATLPLV